MERTWPRLQAAHDQVLASQWHCETDYGQERKAFMSRYEANWYRLEDYNYDNEAITYLLQGTRPLGHSAAHIALTP